MPLAALLAANLTGAFLSRLSRGGSIDGMGTERTPRHGATRALDDGDNYSYTTAETGSASSLSARGTYLTEELAEEIP